MSHGDSNSGTGESVNGTQLQAFIERVERMQEERKAISDDIAEIYAEAKGTGFDTKVMRTIVRIRAQDHAERMEQEALLELYMAALGMQGAPRASARAHTREIIEEFGEDDADGEQIDPRVQALEAGRGDSVGTLPAPSIHDDTAGRGNAACQPATEAGSSTTPNTSNSGDHAAQIAESNTTQNEPAPPAPQAGTDTTGADTNQLSPEPSALVTNSQAKASVGNAVSPTASAVLGAEDRNHPEHDGSGEASRLSDGGGTVAPIPESAIHAAGRSGETPEQTGVEPPAAPVTQFTRANRRDHCLIPDACAASRPGHCYSCERAHLAKLEPIA